MATEIICTYCQTANSPKNNLCSYCLRPLSLQQKPNSTVSTNSNQSLSPISATPTSIKPNTNPPAPPVQPSSNIFTPGNTQPVSTQRQGTIISHNVLQSNLLGTTQYPLHPLPVHLVSKYGQIELEGLVTDTGTIDNKDKSFSTADKIRLVVGVAALFKNFLGGLMTLSGLGTPKPDLKIPYFRVKRADAIEFEVRVGKDLVGGTPAIGDLVALWGYFDKGLFNLKHGFNYRTGAELVLK